MNDFAEYKRLPADERDALGFAKWQENERRGGADAASTVEAPHGLRPFICPTRTVADLVNNLLLLDQALPIYGAQYIEIDGRRRSIAVPPTVSHERVKDGRWIGQGNELNAAVIWTRAEQPAAAAQGDAWTDEDVRELAAIGSAVNRAAIEIPPGARIQIDLGRGEGTVYWMNDAKGAWRHIEGSGELFSAQINAAIDAARAQAQRGCA